jgi:hypothetical protein
MTISATGRRYEYTGDGVTTAFSFPRPFSANADIKVYLVLIATGAPTLQTIATHYTLSGAGNPAGGTVTMLSAPSSAYKVVIFADTDATQNLDLDSVSSWPMTSIEAAFDRLTVMTQEIWDRLTRTVNAPRERMAGFDYTLPLPEAGKRLGINSTATAFELLAAAGASWVTGAGAPAGGTGVTGDMYINTSNGDVYGPKAAGGWGSPVMNIIGPQGPAGSGTGDVVGPASSVNDRVALFNGTTGKLIKDGGVLLSALALLASPALTGNPTAPTPSVGDNDTSIATTAFVMGAGVETISASPSANQDNYAISGVTAAVAIKTILKLTPTNSIKFTGISTSGWATGKELVIRNDGAPTGSGGRLIILERASASSSAANRFNHINGKIPIMLLPGDEASFRFDGTDLKLTGTSRPMTSGGYFDLTNDGALTNAINYTSGTGAGATSNVASTESSGEPIGVVTIETGTTSTGRCIVVLNPSQGNRAGNGCLLHYAQCKPLTLSTVSEEYILAVGFHDGSAGASIVDHIGWEYDRLNSTLWRTVTMSNSTKTANAVSGLTVSATAYHRLGTFVNGDGSNVDFFYSTDEGATWSFAPSHTTNIPTGTSRTFGEGVRIAKSAGTTSILAAVRVAGQRRAHGA